MNKQRIMQLRDLARGLKPYTATEKWFDGTPGGRLLNGEEKRGIEQLNMCYYHAVSECGTVGCLAGLTVLTWPEEARIAAANVLSPGGPPDYVDIGDVAAAVLGLSNKLKYALFHGYDEEPATPEAAAEACQRVLDGKTGAQVWAGLLPEKTPDDVHHADQRD